MNWFSTFILCEREAEELGEEIRDIVKIKAERIFPNFQRKESMWLSEKATLITREREEMKDLGNKKEDDWLQTFNIKVGNARKVF